MGRTKTISARLEERIERVPMSGCWLWTGKLSDSGYGLLSMRLPGRNGPVPVRAHRLSYEQEYGQITDESCVLHKCDVRSCINPYHLFLGDRKDNAQDMISKGRDSSQSTVNRAKTHCKNGHELTEENLVPAYRHRGRICQICWNETQRKHRDKKRQSCVKN